MLFNIPLSKDAEHYCQKIDDHIKEDFETKIPDYGAEAFRPIGFHFKRRGNSVRGIYREKHAKVGGNAFVSQSTHLHFAGRMVTDKNGTQRFRGFMYPQMTQLFMLVISAVFIVLFSMNIADTYLYVGLFAAIFIWAAADTVRLVSLVKKELFKFFK
ncbi:MAG: hypothetical protein IKL24_06935 [Clostridia bacterium]|nr:hypothetical protein [Clostridia bacterium]